MGVVAYNTNAVTIARPLDVVSRIDCRTVVVQKIVDAVSSIEITHIQHLYLHECNSFYVDLAPPL